MNKKVCHMFTFEAFDRSQYYIFFVENFSKVLVFELRVVARIICYIRSKVPVMGYADRDILKLIVKRTENHSNVLRFSSRISRVDIKV